ncbi:MAG: type I restriction endonuclease [Bacteroidota bacterium]
MSYSPEYLQSEKPALDLLRQLGYQYQTSPRTQERANTSEVLLLDRLRRALQTINPWISPENVERALGQLTSVTGNSLLEINQKVWERIRGEAYSVKQVVAGQETFIPVRYIDFQHPANNDFLVVNQMSYRGKYTHSIPDIVVYLNGLPVAVIECKAPGIADPWGSAYQDLGYYQKNSPRLFYYNQICVGLWRDHGRYGALAAPKAFYSVAKFRPEEWPEGLGAAPTEQDQLLYYLFEPRRLLELIRHFVLFERAEGQLIKKLPRAQQWRATNQTIARLQDDRGGVVWHTQGSGKSLTMAYVIRKLQAREYGFNNPTVLVMTDRQDLDRQITTTLRAVGFANVYQASSVVHLDQLLRNDYGGIITTTIQKFQQADREATEQADQTVEEEKENRKVEKRIEGRRLTKITKVKADGKWVEREREVITLEELSRKENLYVLVDEAHRSQYGFLAAFMRTMLPRAKFVAFTGTPISKEDKSTLAEFYGGQYIDVYTILESVADGATKELFYDAGVAQLAVKKEALDAEFAATFGHLPKAKRDQLKSDALRKYQGSKERMEAIAGHLLRHFGEKIRPDGHKAMVVCAGRAQALKYKRIFEALKAEGVHAYESKLIITLGSPKSDPIAREYHEILAWNQAHPERARANPFTPMAEIKTVTEDFKLPYGKATELEKSGAKKNDNTAFLIVSDMLLTGYDVPIASCLYLDKPLKEHNLLQALARVNRTGKGKQAGYVVDYCGISGNLVEALEIFSGDIRPHDILTKVNEEVPRLDQHHTRLVAFFKPVRIDRKYERELFLDKALHFVQPINRRDAFFNLLRRFNKSVGIVLPNPKGLPYEFDFKLFNELRARVRNAEAGNEDLKTTGEESQLLQTLIDEHLKASGLQSLLEAPISIIDKEKFKAQVQYDSPETQELKIRNNLRYTIRVGAHQNPDFFKPLAERLDELLKMKEEERISNTQLLIDYAELQDRIILGDQESRAKGFDTEQKRAVYNSMQVIFAEAAEAQTRLLFARIEGELDLVEWQDKGQVRKVIENKICKILEEKMEKGPARRKAKVLVELLAKRNNA